MQRKRQVSKGARIYLRPVRFGIGTALALLALVAQAEENAGKPTWSFGGFGTVGAVYSDEPDADFVSTILKSRGAGYSDRISADVDTRLGAQVSVVFNKHWSAVLQVVSEQSASNSHAPVVEWANIKYQITPDLNVRLGRIALPMLLAADYRKAAYAYTAVRTPVEVYGTVPITNSDGVDASFRWNIGDMKNVSQVFFGGNDLSVNDTVTSSARNLAGLSHTIESGPASVRLGFLRTELSIDVAPELFAGLRQFGAQGEALAERYEVADTPVRVISVGLNYDPGTWFATGEWVHMATRSFIGKRTAWFLSAGYRLGKFTPYLGFAKATANSQTEESGLPLSGLPAPLAAAAGGLNTGLSALVGSIPVQKTVTLGARWDALPNLAVKFQYDRLAPQGASRGSLINVQPQFRSGGIVNVLSLSLDFVF